MNAKIKDLFDTLLRVDEPRDLVKRTTVLYVEMHDAILRDIICDSELDSWIHTTKPTVIDRGFLENYFKFKIFINNNHPKESVTITYQSEVLIV